MPCRIARKNAARIVREMRARPDGGGCSFHDQIFMTFLSPRSTQIRLNDLRENINVSARAVMRFQVGWSGRCQQFHRKTFFSSLACLGTCPAGRVTGRVTQGERDESKQI